MLGSRLVKQVGVDHADLVNQQHISGKPPVPDLRMWTAHSTREQRECNATFSSNAQGSYTTHTWKQLF